MSRLHIRLSRCASTYARFSSRVVALNFKRYLSTKSLSLASIALLGLPMIFASQASASTVSYLAINPPPAYISGTPTTSTLSSPTTYNLPGYGNVEVSWSAPANLFINQQDIPSANNGQAGTYTWLTDTQDINLLNHTGTTASYTVRFTFLPGQPPDLSRLVLVVTALGYGTKATIPTGSLLGEYQLQLGSPTSPVILTAGTTLSSGWTSNATNYLNTGWALFKISSTLPTSGSSSYLEVAFSEVNNDGIGVTLGYTEPEEQGYLKICKVAGDGVNVGDKFDFTAVSTATGASSSVTVTAGPAPGGYCSFIGGYAVGDTVTLTETTAGYRVTQIVVAPANPLAQTNLGNGSVNVPIGTGITEVTYTDERAEPGYLEICKFAFGGVEGDVTFSVTPSMTPGQPAQVVIPAVSGLTCSPAIQVPSGQVVIHETPPPGAEMTWCVTYPENRQVGSDCAFAVSTSTVMVVPGNISTQTVAVIVNGPTTARGHTRGHRQRPPKEALPPWMRRSH